MRIAFVILLMILIYCVLMEGRISVTRLGQKDVHITGGPIRGLIVDFYPVRSYLPPVEVFRGIQYHITRGKTLRLFPPRPSYETWDNQKHMSTFSKPCFQRKLKAMDTLPDTIQTRMSRLKHFTKGTIEDCLYLNVYAPKSGKIHIIKESTPCCLMFKKYLKVVIVIWYEKGMQRDVWISRSDIIFSSRN